MLKIKISYYNTLLNTEFMIQAPVAAMVLMMGHYPDCNSGPPCLVVDDYKK